MTKGLMRLAAIAASGAAFLVLTGCGGASPDDGYGGPPPQAYDRDAPAPDLMGGSTPPARRGDGSGLLGGPVGDATMAPIPNPGDLTKAERVRWYGHKYDHLPEPKGRRAGAGDPRHQLLTRRKPDGTLEVSMRPIPNPEDMSPAERRRVYGYRYAPRAVTTAAPRRRQAAAPVAAPRPAAAVRPAVVAKPAPKPVAVPAPRAVAAAPIAKPVAPLKTAPKAALPAPAPKPTPAQQLSAAVRPEVMKGAVLTVPEGLAKGQEAKVSLSLPATLLDVIKREAGKLGLGKAAKKAEVSATLTGDGYEITPNAAQTQKLKAGEAARFDWNVKPGTGDKAPLKATVDGTLTGDRKAKTAFSLGALEQAVAAPVEEVKKVAKGFHFPAFSLKALSIPGKPVVDLPVVGKTASEKVVGAGIALLALLAVLGMARSASAGRARAERRRKFRTMADYGRTEPDPAPEPAPAHEPHAEHQSYVNPMLAAAGGAAVGAAVTHAAHEHHDHQVEEAAAEDHGHDAHPVEHHAEPEAHESEPVSHVEHAPAEHVEHVAHEAPAHEHHREHEPA